jgi:hypothetical protein
MAESRVPPVICNLARIDLTCFARRSGLALINLPLFQRSRGRSGG